MQFLNFVGELYFLLCSGSKTEETIISLFASLMTMPTHIDTCNLKSHNRVIFIYSVFNISINHLWTFVIYSDHFSCQMVRIKFKSRCTFRRNILAVVILITYRYIITNFYHALLDSSCGDHKQCLHRDCSYWSYWSCSVPSSLP